MEKKFIRSNRESVVAAIYAVRKNEATELFLLKVKLQQVRIFICNLH